ncbi:MAG: hypothetical protein ACEPOZ_21515 [Marinifilaceae bacterium]
MQGGRGERMGEEVSRNREEGFARILPAKPWHRIWRTGTHGVLTYDQIATCKPCFAVLAGLSCCIGCVFDPSHNQFFKTVKRS